MARVSPLETTGTRRSADRRLTGHGCALPSPAVDDAGSGLQGGDVTPDERAYLRAIADTPAMTATERDQWLGVPPSTGHLRRRVLEAKGYLRLLPVRTGRRGGAAVLVALTDRALCLLGRPRPPGQAAQRDPLLRAYYGKQIAAWAAGQGWQAEVQADDGPADVLIRRPSGGVVIRIILDGDDAERAALRAAGTAAEVYLVAPNASALRSAVRAVRHRLPPTVSGRVHVASLAQLLTAGMSAEFQGDGAPALPARGSPSARASPRPVPHPADGSGRQPSPPPAGGRRRRHAGLSTHLAQALRHIDDAFALDHLPLADLPAAAAYRRRYAGRTAARGRAVQHLLRDAVERITETRPGGAFERFARAYVAGATVAAAARRAGVSREHASRVFRPRLVDHLVIELRAIAHGAELK